MSQEKKYEVLLFCAVKNFCFTSFHSLSEYEEFFWKLVLVFQDLDL